MIHGPNGETTVPTAGNAAVELPVRDTPGTIPEP